MNLRYGLQDDCRRIYDLICEMEEKVLPYDHFSRIWEKQIANPDYISLVCEEDGTVIGVLNLRLEEQLHHTQLVAEIMEMAVKAEYRSSGIGKALIRWAYQIAQEKGCLRHKTRGRARAEQPEKADRHFRRGRCGAAHRRVHRHDRHRPQRRRQDHQQQPGDDPADREHAAADGRARRADTGAHHCAYG